MEQSQSNIDNKSFTTRKTGKTEKKQKQKGNNYLRNDRDTAFGVVFARVHQRRLVVAVVQPWFRAIGTRQQHSNHGQITGIATQHQRRRQNTAVAPVHVQVVGGFLVHQHAKAPAVFARLWSVFVCEKV